MCLPTRGTVLTGRNHNIVCGLQTLVIINQILSDLKNVPPFIRNYGGSSNARSSPLPYSVNGI